MKRMSFETTFSKYTPDKIIGEGGSGRVFRASDESGNLYAIKLLDPKRATSEKRRRFKNELNFCLRTQHQNIITIIDHGIYIRDRDKSPFYVMPLYECSLRNLMEIGIDPAKILPYFSQILDGVEAAHLNGVIHRDLKPENFLYDPTSDKLLVADFGIAQFSEDELFTLVETKPNSRLANFQYAAPEQRTRGIPVDHRADIFALGLILNEMFTGEIPHGTGFKTIGSVAPKYEYLDGLVAEILQQSTKARPNSIEIVKRELKARGHDFVESQRLSQLKQTVIPVSDIDDPLIADPPRIVNFDWTGKELILMFNQALSPKWHWALCNMGGYTSIMGKGPDRFKIFGNKATINASGHEVQRIIDYFKEWLPRANRNYEETIRREKREAEEKERQRLRRQIEAQEDRLRVLKSIKI